MVRDYAIATDNLTRRYERFEAVSRLNLHVPRHQITGFLGRNGAGKSTTIKMLLGMTHPSGASGTVLGHPISNAKESCAIRRDVAYVGEEKQLYGTLTVTELILAN
jgi:ABC-2 type transport system ATP-binding protein